ncbi:tail fiber assembly protein [Providencia rettgeri]
MMSSVYAVIEDMKVVNVIVWDGEAEITALDNQTLINISNVRESVGIGWSYFNSDFIAPPIPELSHEELVSEAEYKKQQLLAEATDAIAPLQDAVDLDMATDEESALLKEWKKYRVLLNRVDTSTAPDIEWPEKP